MFLFLEPSWYNWPCSIILHLWTWRRTFSEKILLSLRGSPLNWEKDILRLFCAWSNKWPKLIPEKDWVLIKLCKRYKNSRSNKTLNQTSTVSGKIRRTLAASFTKRTMLYRLMFQGTNFTLEIRLTTMFKVIICIKIKILGLGSIPLIHYLKTLQ